MSKNYESPRMEIVEIEEQGVLCISTPQTTNPSGSTENVGRSSFSF